MDPLIKLSEMHLALLEKMIYIFIARIIVTVRKNAALFLLCNIIHSQNLIVYIKKITYLPYLGYCVKYRMSFQSKYVGC